MDNVKQVYDIAIVGGGPAGLTAGLYARRANRSVLILEKATFGGQITFSPKVENIPGFPVLSGNEFAERLVDQVLALGAEMESAEVLGMEPAEGGWLIHTDGGDFAGRTVIPAHGTADWGWIGKNPLSGMAFLSVLSVMAPFTPGARLP